MNNATLPKIKNVKVLRKEERSRTSGSVITSKDAIRLGLPDNCIVMPMKILKRPEPIKRGNK